MGAINACLNSFIPQDTTQDFMPTLAAPSGADTTQDTKLPAKELPRTSSNVSQNSEPPKPILKRGFTVIDEDRFVMTYFDMTDEEDKKKSYMLYLNHWFNDILKWVEYISESSNIEARNFYRSVLQRSLNQFFNELAYLELRCPDNSDSSTDTTYQAAGTSYAREEKSSEEEGCYLSSDEIEQYSQRK